MRSIFLLFLPIIVLNSPICQAMDLPTCKEKIDSTEPFTFQSAIEKFAITRLPPLSKNDALCSKLNESLWIIWRFGMLHCQHFILEDDVKEFIEHVLTANPSPLVSAINDCISYIKDKFQNVSCDTLRDIENLDRGYPELDGLAFLIKRTMISKVSENIARTELKTIEPILLVRHSCNCKFGCSHRK